MIFSYLGGGPFFKCVLEDYFDKTFSQESCKNAWSKVGAAPLTRKSLSDIKVDHVMGDDEEEYPVSAVYCNIQQKNKICVNHLLSIGYNGNLLSTKLKEKTKSVKASLTVPHLQARIQSISTSSMDGEKTHYEVFKSD